MEDRIEINGTWYVKEEKKMKTSEDDIISRAQEFINNYDWESYELDIAPEILSCVADDEEENYDGIKLNVPVASDKWTFKIFDFIRDFVEEFPNSSPLHREGDENLYISLEYC